MIELIVNFKKVRFFVDGGWFKGEDFSLIKIELFHAGEDGALYILSLQIAKLSFLFGVEATK